jgi:SAM-dependent methyltransferase
MSHHRRSTCRGCGAERLSPFLDLGPMPLANAYPRSALEIERERAWPLAICSCGACGLVQTPDVVDRELLFGSYPYLTGVSSGMIEHFAAYARRVVERIGLVPGDLVVEIGSNDGTLLECFRREGVRTLGVEAAIGVAERARRRGIDTVAGFFDAGFADELRRERGEARVVVANNVLAHVDEPARFLSGCRALVEGVAGGAVVVEVPWLADLLERLAYDTMYHEHLCHFSLGSLLPIFSAAGLEVERVERVPVHGGSLRIWASPRRTPRAPVPQVLEWVDLERAAGLSDPQRLARFAREVAGSQRELVGLLRSLKERGAKIAGCGAPAKGNVLLNACRIGTDLVEYTVDRNPLKVGSWTPGMHLPILPASTLEERRPDYALLLAWNLRDEMRTEHRGWLEAGGRFVLPIPHAEVLP